MKKILFIIFLCFVFKGFGLSTSIFDKTDSWVNKNIYFESIKSNEKFDYMNNKRINNYLNLQLGGIFSIFNLGYGVEFKGKNKFSYSLNSGFGLDFFRVRRPYFSFEWLVKLKLIYNFKNKNSIYFGLGNVFVFNPWYMVDKEKYYFECERQRCPESQLYYFFNVGFAFDIGKKIKLSPELYINTDFNNYIILPGVELKYYFK